MAVRYFSVADVVALHTEMMERMGERAARLRDAGLLESALLRPQMAAHYDDADLMRQTAVLAVGISQNQPFVDGNKRAAFMALLVFSRVNGQAFDGDHLELAQQIEAVAARQDALDAATDRFESWLRMHVSVA